MEHTVAPVPALTFQVDGRVKMILSPDLSEFVSGLIVTFRLVTAPAVVTAGISVEVVAPSAPTVMAGNDAELV
jgi:hypothetical protein